MYVAPDGTVFRDDGTGNPMSSDPSVKMSMNDYIEVIHSAKDAAAADDEAYKADILRKRAAAPQGKIDRHNAYLAALAKKEATWARYDAFEAAQRGIRTKQDLAKQMAIDAWHTQGVTLGVIDPDYVPVPREPKKPPKSHGPDRVPPKTRAVHTPLTFSIDHEEFHLPTMSFAAIHASEMKNAVKVI